MKKITEFLVNDTTVKQEPITEFLINKPIKGNTYIVNKINCSKLCDNLLEDIKAKKQFVSWMIEHDEKLGKNDQSNFIVLGTGNDYKEIMINLINKLNLTTSNYDIDDIITKLDKTKLDNKDEFLLDIVSKINNRLNIFNIKNKINIVILRLDTNRLTWISSNVNKQCNFYEIK